MGQRQFILILSALIGLLVGLAAVVIKNLVHLIQELLTVELVQGFHHALYFIFPMIGILLVVLYIQYINKRPVQHGIPGVLHAISTTGANLEEDLFNLIAHDEYRIIPDWRALTAQMEKDWKNWLPQFVRHRQPQDDRTLTQKTGRRRKFTHHE